MPLEGMGAKCRAFAAKRQDRRRKISRHAAICTRSRRIILQDFSMRPRIVIADGDCTIITLVSMRADTAP
jgi:hypothetical protein